MSRTPQLTKEMAELLAAVVAALDLPIPSVDVADERAHDRLLELRATDVRIVLDTLIRFSSSPGSVARNAAEIRRRTDREPVDYAPFVSRVEEGTS
ncbi:hypothetical protein [Streptomyces sp. DT171]|uniref:hypothetical protein n=1 Tax=Streptomyces sp. DT171 TaxID=3416524 RepID=UPI003CF7C2FC